MSERPPGGSTMRRASALLAFCIAALLAATTSAASSSQEQLAEDLSETVGRPVVSEQDVRSIDTAMYVELHGISTLEATTQIAQREAIQGVLDLTDEYPQYADSWIDRSDGFQMFIAFSGGVPESFREAAAAFSATLTLVGDAPYTLAELEAEEALVQEQLFASGFDDFATTIDGRLGRILVAIGSVDSTDISVPEAALRPNIDLTTQSGPTGEAEHTYGGDTLFNTNNPNKRCTTGFSVRVNGVEGVLTAGHCANQRTYRENSGLEYVAPFKQAHQGTYGDFQWHTTPHANFDDYYFNDTQLRDVSAVGGKPMIGDTICFHGEKTGGSHCDEVEKRPHSQTYKGILYKRLVRMEEDHTSGGDSGGPWFWLGTAYGIHHGDSIDSNGVRRNVWSQARFADNAISGLTIRTN